MEEWKQTVMTEVAQKLQGIKPAHEEAMGIQGQGFQLELERVKEKLEIVESKAVVLEKEVQLLKGRKPTLEKELDQSAHAIQIGKNKSVTGQWRAQIVAQAQVAQQRVTRPQYCPAQSRQRNNTHQAGPKELCSDSSTERNPKLIG